MKRHYIILVLALILLIVINTQNTTALPLNSCTPDNCPEGYKQTDKVCSNGSCYVTCKYYTGCNTSDTLEYNAAEYLPDLNIPSYSGAYNKEFVIGSYTPTNKEKCYQFYQTTPNNFISSSDIDGYSSLNNFDAGISLHWTDPSRSRWYDNQRNYSRGEMSEFLGSNDGGVWVDSCVDSGDNFDSADSYVYTNSLYCAPTQTACNNFSQNCDTECYDINTELQLVLNTELKNGLSCNNFNDFDKSSSGSIGAEIDFVNFNAQSVFMVVNSYDAILNHSFNNTCNYIPQCNPADPCCDSSGNYRSNGYVCNGAHNPTCNSVNSSACGGQAYEDRCTGSSAICPDNNYVISYPQACDGQVCTAQSCSGSALQPQRTCNAGICQRNDPFACPNNLLCNNSTSCKLFAAASSDCNEVSLFNSTYRFCYGESDSGDVSNDFVYDSNGNLNRTSNFTYDYNGLNQLIGIRYTNGTLIANYTYDDKGLRIRKFIPKSNTTIYYVDKFVQIVNSSGNYNETYYYYYDFFIAKKDNSNAITIYGPDLLGTASVITYPNGTVQDVGLPEPFGYSDNTGQRYSFTGYESDVEAELLYAKARYYDPKNGQFIQPDPLIADIYNPQNLNKYSYVLNNPYTYTDPTGKYVSPLDILDYASLAYSTYSLIKDPSAKNFGFFAVDLVSAAIPVVGGGGIIVKAGEKGISKLDEVGDVARKIPNPYGSKGSPAHQKKIQEIAEELADKNLKVQREVTIKDPLMGKIRRADIVGIDRTTDEIVEIHQVGRTNLGGTPVSRERKAILDIQNAISSGAIGRFGTVEFTISDRVGTFFTNYIKGGTI